LLHLSVSCCLHVQSLLLFSLVDEDLVAPMLLERLLLLQCALPLLPFCLRCGVGVGEAPFMLRFLLLHALLVGGRACLELGPLLRREFSKLSRRAQYSLLGDFRLL